VHTGLVRRYGYMIDNIILVITGTLHNRSSEELLEKCHPLGLFDSMVRAARSTEGAHTWLGGAVAAHGLACPSLWAAARERRVAVVAAARAPERVEWPSCAALSLGGSRPPRPPPPW